MNDTNRMLLDTYQKHYDDLYKFKANKDNLLNGPFLICPNEKYYASTLKLAFVGQETRGWGCSSNVASQMDTYRAFNLGEEYYSSPFWNVMRKFELRFKNEEYSSAWLNINRYDENDGKPSDALLNELSSIDYLLIKELQLISPDIIIFFTGPDYDERILRILDATISSIDNFTSRQFCEFKSPLVHASIFRTYHPNYLRRSGLEKRELENMVENIKMKWQTQRDKKWSV